MIFKEDELIITDDWDPFNSRAIDIFQAWYNFIKPHKSLRLTVNCGNKKWLQRTPAMAQKLTNHIWTLKELLTFRVPVQ